MSSTLPQRVSFFPYSEWDADRECVAFIALVDGKRARCMIAPDALKAFASSDGSTPLHVYSEHREAIEELASSLIQQGRLDGRELMIQAQDVRGGVDAGSEARGALESDGPAAWA